MGYLGGVFAFYVFVFVFIFIFCFVVFLFFGLVGGVRGVFLLVIV